MPLYTSTGAFNVAVNDTTGRGRYSASGALRINLVTGASYVGLYAADGALNVVDVSGIAVSTYGGLYHPSGAIRGRTAPNTLSGLQAPDGSYYLNGLFSPLNIFSAGEQGVWYDPSDFSTMFQDNAGTTPVTAVEQTVGLILDKSKGLTLGTELITNGNFATDTNWTKGTGWTISGGVASFSAGTGSELTQTGRNFAANTTYKITFDMTQVSGGGFRFIVDTTGSFVSSYFTTTASHTLVFSVGATSTRLRLGALGGASFSIDNISIKALAGTHASQSTLASRPTLSARVNQLVATATLSTQSVTTLAATYTLAFSGTGTVTATGTNIGVYSAGSNSLVCTAGTLTLTVVGSVTLADLRVTNDGVGLPTYQNVVTSTNYDTSGFPLFLRFDGNDDSLATTSITPGTDKAPVFAGIRKTSDAALAIVAELSATIASNAGSFALTAPNSAAANYNFSSKGTTQTDNTVTTYTSPLTSVLSGIADIAGASNLIRVNGVQVGSVLTTQGTGNYLAYPLYIGRRGGTSNPFTGRLYSLIMRFGANLSDAQITSTETWINGKTKAY